MYFKNLLGPLLERSGQPSGGAKLSQEAMLMWPNSWVLMGLNRMGLNFIF